MESKQAMPSIEELRSALEDADDPHERCRLQLLLVRALHARYDPATIAAVEAAVAMTRALGDPELHSEAEIVAGFAYLYRNDLEHARTALERAARLAATAGNVVRSAQALHGIASMDAQRGEYRAAALGLSHALELALASGDETTIARTRSALGGVYDRLGDTSRGLELHHLVLEYAETSGDRALHCLTLSALADASQRLGVPRRSAEYAHAALRLAVASNDINGEISAGSNLASAYAEMGDYAAARRQCTEALTLCMTVEDERYLIDLLALSGSINLGMGRPLAALLDAERSCAMADSLGVPISPGAVIVAADACTALGRHDEAARYVDLCLAAASDRGDRSYEVPALERRAASLERAGDVQRALEIQKRLLVVREELAGAEQQRLMMRLELEHEIDAARRERESLRVEAVRLRAEMERKDRELAAMALRLAERSELLGALGAEISDVSMKVDDGARATVRSLARRIQAGVDRGAEWKAFEEQFRQVHPEFNRLLLERCAKLSRTELRIAALLRVGLSSKEIAGIVNASERTVEWHRSNLRAKLDLPKETNLATWFASL